MISFSFFDRVLLRIGGSNLDMLHLNLLSMPSRSPIFSFWIFTILGHFLRVLRSPFFNSKKRWKKLNWKEKLPLTIQNICSKSRITNLKVNSMPKIYSYK